MDAELVFITPEDAPLGVLGEQASSGVARTLEEAGIRVETSAFADIEEHGKIFTRPDHKQFEVDRVVAMPVMDGPAVVGIDCDEHGFIPVDEHGRVAGADDVYAAGDGIDFPIKQGGIATQQADVVAADIARRVGVETGVDPDRPIVRVKLLTGHGARYSADESKLSQHALWWPPGKIAGAYLAPYLAGMELEPPPDREVHDLEIPLGGAP
jgi:sulfide:quinone oxidoreductase